MAHWACGCGVVCKCVAACACCACVRRRAQAPAGAKYMQYQGPPGPPRAKKAILGQILDFLETSPPAPTRNRGCGMSTTGLQIQKSGTKIDLPTFCVFFFVCTVKPQEGKKKWSYSSLGTKFQRNTPNFDVLVLRTG